MEGDIRDGSMELAQRTLDAGRKLAERVVGRVVGTIDTASSRVADMLPDEVTDRVVQARERISDVPLVRGIVSYVPGLGTERSEPQPTRLTSGGGTAKKTASRSSRTSPSASHSSR